MLFQRKTVYPSKTTVNLAVQDKLPGHNVKLLCFAAVFAVLLGLFCKFAVIDRLNAAARAQSQAAQAGALLSELRRENADYEKVQVEYAMYFSPELSQVGEMPADCIEVLELIERSIMPQAGISAAKFSGDSLSLELTGINLDGTAELLSALETSQIVGNVELFTADSGKGDCISMTVTLIEMGGGEK